MAELVYASVSKTDPFGLGVRVPPPAALVKAALINIYSSVIRKSSYYVSIPGSIKIAVRGHNPAVLLKGPLGRVAVQISSKATFCVEKSYLK